MATLGQTQSKILSCRSPKTTRASTKMNLHLEQNVDLLLIENTNLQEEVKILTKKLATQIEKYNSLSTVLQTQSDFMKEIESKVELIAKREKPLKDEVERLRRERNDAIGNDENVTPAKCQMLETEKQDITASRRRMEEENVWLVEQLHLSRRVGQDMEALVSARMDLQKTRDGEKVPTDLGERIHELHIEKTRLENDKQDLLHRVNLLSKDITSTLQVAEDWKIKCKKRQGNRRFSRNVGFENFVIRKRQPSPTIKRIDESTYIR